MYICMQRDMDILLQRWQICILIQISKGLSSFYLHIGFCDKEKSHRFRLSSKTNWGGGGKLQHTYSVFDILGHPRMQTIVVKLDLNKTLLQ